MRRSRATYSGFTLIELVLVLLLLSVIVAMAAPNMRGWSEGAKLRNTADDFMNAAYWAQNEAIITAGVQVLTIDTSSQTFSVKPEAPTGIEHHGPFSTPVTLPTDFTIAVISGGDGAGAIRFYPDGRVTPGVVQITSPHQETIDIASTSPAMQFKLVNKN